MRFYPRRGSQTDALEPGSFNDGRSGGRCAIALRRRLTIRIEESVREASERDEVDVELTGVVLNGPTIHRGAGGALPDVSIDRR